MRAMHELAGCLAANKLLVKNHTPGVCQDESAGDCKGCTVITQAQTPCVQLSPPACVLQPVLTGCNLGLGMSRWDSTCASAVSLCNRLIMTIESTAQSVICGMQSAVDALLSAYTEQEWQLSFSSLSKQVARVGPSHRAHLVALKYLPAHNPRGFALQQAATASMLQGLCKIPTKVCMPRLSFMSCTSPSLPQAWRTTELCFTAILIRSVEATYDGTAFGQSCVLPCRRLVHSLSGQSNMQLTQDYPE